MHFEGDVLHQYLDQAGYWTIAKGHLMRPAEIATGLISGKVQAVRDSKGRWAVTEEQSDEIFRIDTAGCLFDLNRLYTGERELEEWEVDALILWDFNTGGFQIVDKATGRLVPSGVMNALNDQRWADVPTEMLRWNHRRDPKTKLLVVDEGLTMRRQAEVGIWLHGYDNGETKERLRAADEAETAGRAFGHSFTRLDLLTEDDMKSEIDA